MSGTRVARVRRWATAGAVVAGAVAQLGFVESCDNRLVGLTQYFDPCGTFLANCTPGSFIANRAEIGDYCVDPECTVPGGCGTGQQPLGTIRDICP
ncbi:MAG: hypothetical protein HY763_06475 [Planctomycetes bacterium]|nr:hypothetical protein [Planctomycetota bacterium]